MAVDLNGSLLYIVYARESAKEALVVLNEGRWPENILRENQKLGTNHKKRSDQR